MKHRFLMVFIIISVFILGTLAALLYKKNSSDRGSADKVTVSEVSYEDENAGRSDDPERKSEEGDDTDGSEDSEDADDSEDDTDTDEGSDDATDDTDEETAEDAEDPDEEPAPDADEDSNDADDGEDSDVSDGDANDQTPSTGDPNKQSLPILPKFDELLQVNPYVSGWLTIDGSTINYPVVYTPGSQNYFLHRDIYGGNNSKGTLFIAINWRNGFNNTLIYGHNMKDGTGFGSLSKFADPSYGLSHRVIHFDTLYEEREYDLLGVFYSQIDEDELETEEDRSEKDNTIEAAAIAKKEAEIAESEGTEVSDVHVEPQQLTLFDIDLNRDFGDADIFRAEKDDDRGRFRYYYYTDLADKDDFDYFVKNVRERSLYDTGAEAEWGDELITLSTCSYQVKNGRFVLVGVRKR